MHYTKVKMKDGRKFEGIIWEWRPVEGYFTLAADESAPDRIMLSEVEEAVTPRVYLNRHTVGDRDELARARDDVAFAKTRPPKGST